MYTFTIKSGFYNDISKYGGGIVELFTAIRIKGHFLTKFLHSQDHSLNYIYEILKGTHSNAVVDFRLVKR